MKKSLTTILEEEYGEPTVPLLTPAEIRAGIGRPAVTPLSAQEDAIYRDHLRALAGLGRQSPKPGDLIFCHRKGIIPAIIRLGQRFRAPRDAARWTHVALVGWNGLTVEALTHGVCENPWWRLTKVPHEVVPTNLDGVDLQQAIAFARSCVGQRYGWWTILGVALRYLTPGRGPRFGQDGTEICSGLCAQALVRGWYNFQWEPASMSPAELWSELHR